MRQIKLGDITVDVVLKDIKNIHLSVHPPKGRVSISAPLRMKLDIIRVFAVSKLGWIKRQQKKLQEQERETQRGYLDRESHYVWGKRYLLSISEVSQKWTVELKHKRMILRVRPGTDEDKRRAIIEEWYRTQIKQEASDLIAKWEALIGVKVSRYFVQRMKTKWGSCNHRASSIRLNTDLAKKPKECVEYIIVHEMAHMLEPTHNARFIALMNQFMPKWQFLQNQLNRLPVSHENWRY
jgi:predicted metal-dependent hydrolase